MHVRFLDECPCACVCLCSVFSLFCLLPAIQQRPGATSGAKKNQGIFMHGLAVVLSWATALALGSCLCLGRLPFALVHCFCPSPGCLLFFCFEVMLWPWATASTLGPSDKKATGQYISSPRRNQQPDPACLFSLPVSLRSSLLAHLISFSRSLSLSLSLSLFLSRFLYLPPSLCTYMYMSKVFVHTGTNYTHS